MVSSVLLGVLLAQPKHPRFGVMPPVAPFGKNPLPDERVTRSMIFPVLGTPRWRNDFAVERGQYLHTGVDIRAPKMTPVVAPFDGVIGFKTESFWIYSPDGWIMLGTHMNDDTPGTDDNLARPDLMFAPDLVPGGKVIAGQFIGYVGNSGNATGPHLHFELYAPGRGRTQERIRNPFWSLQASQRLTAPRPNLFNPGDTPSPGQVRIDGCVRIVDQFGKKVTLILVAETRPGGQPTAITTPTYGEYLLTDEQAEALGGWQKLRERPNNRPITLFVKPSPEKPEVATRAVAWPL